MEKWKPIEIPKLKTVSIKDRRSKVALDNLGKPWRSGESLQVFLSSLPDVLAARDLREVVQSIVRARKNGRPVILGMGAHPIKVGLSPIIINLMSRGVITGIAPVSYTHLTLPTN